MHAHRCPFPQAVDVPERIAPPGTAEPPDGHRWTAGAATSLPPWLRDDRVRTILCGHDAGPRVLRMRPGGDGIKDGNDLLRASAF